MTKVGSMKTTNWLDEQGIAVRTQMNMGGLDIDIRQSSEAEAKKEEPAPNDFLMNTILSLDEAIPENAKHCVFRLSVPEGKLIGISYEGKTQKLNRIDERTIEVEVLAEDWQAIRNGKGHPGQVDREFREANILIDSGDKLIKRLAQEACRGSKNVFQMAEKTLSFRFALRLEEKLLSRFCLGERSRPQKGRRLYRTLDPSCGLGSSDGDPLESSLGPCFTSMNSRGLKRPWFTICGLNSFSREDGSTSIPPWARCDARQTESVVRQFPARTIAYRIHASRGRTHGKTDRRKDHSCSTPSKGLNPAPVGSSNSPIKVLVFLCLKRR